MSQESLRYQPQYQKRSPLPLKDDKDILICENSNQSTAADLRSKNALSMQQLEQCVQDNQSSKCPSNLTINNNSSKHGNSRSVKFSDGNPSKDSQVLPLGNNNQMREGRNKYEEKQQQQLELSRNDIGRQGAVEGLQQSSQQKQLQSLDQDEDDHSTIQSSSSSLVSESENWERLAQRVQSRNINIAAIDEKVSATENTNIKPVIITNKDRNNQIAAGYRIQGSQSATRFWESPQSKQQQKQYTEMSSNSPNHLFSRQILNSDSEKYLHSQRPQFFQSQDSEARLTAAGIQEKRKNASNYHKMKTNEFSNQLEKQIWNRRSDQNIQPKIKSTQQDIDNSANERLSDSNDCDSSRDDECASLREQLKQSTREVSKLTAMLVEEKKKSADLELIIEKYRITCQEHELGVESVRKQADVIAKQYEVNRLQNTAVLEREMYLKFNEELRFENSEILGKAGKLLSKYKELECKYLASEAINEEITILKAKLLENDATVRDLKRQNQFLSQTQGKQLYELDNIVAEISDILAIQDIQTIPQCLKEIIRTNTQLLEFQNNFTSFIAVCRQPINNNNMNESSSRQQQSSPFGSSSPNSRQYQSPERATTAASTSSLSKRTPKESVDSAWRLFKEIFNDYLTLRKNARLDKTLGEILIKTLRVSSRHEIIPVFTQKVVDNESYANIIAKLRSYLKISNTCSLQQLSDDIEQLLIKRNTYAS